MSDYNGWKNYQTWNVGLWLDNDEELYAIARLYRRRSYTALLRGLERRGITHTGDGVAFADKRVSRTEITHALREF